MQPRRKKKVLSAKMTGQTCETLKDLAERTYLTTVRLYLCSTSMHWPADEIIERNITSSDVEFLEGEDEEKKSNHPIEKVTRKAKDKPENTRVLIDKAKNSLMTSDLSGLQVDVEMNDNRSVHDQMIDKRTYFINWQPGGLRK